MFVANSCWSLVCVFTILFQIHNPSLFSITEQEDVNEEEDNIMTFSFRVQVYHAVTFRVGMRSPRFHRSDEKPSFPSFVHTRSSLSDVGLGI